MTPFATLSIAAFLDQLGAKTPAPGGGAVAAITGAAAASVARMVVSYSLGKKNLGEHQAHLTESAAALNRARDLFLELADADAEAYSVLNELQKLPETDSRRIAQFPAAAHNAVQIPMTCAAAGSDLLRACESLVTRTNRYLRSDLAIAAVLAEATVSAACWNVRVNLQSLPDEPQRAPFTLEIDRLLRESATRRTAVEQGCA